MMKNASGFPRAQELRKGWRGLFSLFLLSLFLSPVFHLQAGVYKWVDENGRVHFSDRPTAAESTEVEIKQQERSAPSADQHNRQLKMQRMLEVYQEDREEKKEAKQKQQEEKAKRKQNCARAKDRYNSHVRARGIYRYDKDGERQYLSDEERTRHMKSIKAEIARWCK
ncbi:MAG: hypothetical protein B6D72_05605 [gamma proteobacterium symbiont of Ctena orbiculata]|uniref:DUF4124 domain-containing protein n=1 Tax=Candidatus Thiodiazotropha taylori TaxID=2792791 RepID=A0A944MCT9_9GAMM|nr:DUF4124 domain-containing protein [Candidatus Thiodiazotropha taylori]PUB89861.1 MAG: hypothetical protein DBP00_01475 [gamma proteobacterium symbiont of Ctena orbiculata]MBT3028958.1 DUF4124 domain-containing protein [Candidatus Thiodiazotropha taylori]MBT3036599.1 DUF4124 domain-containing protein [Candidatus Thiodiazotropha taylori]MBV2135175.1 DUF4124 domain-containing protein [Candidatus Thiodiazotropha taylori]